MTTLHGDGQTTTGGGHFSGDLQGLSQLFVGLQTGGGVLHANEADVVTPATMVASITAFMSFFIDTLLYSLFL